MLTLIIVVYCVDAHSMRDVCKVLHFETCLGASKDAGGDMRVASDGQSPVVSNMPSGSIRTCE